VRGGVRDRAADGGRSADRSSACTCPRPSTPWSWPSTRKAQIQALDRTAPCLPILPTTPARMTHDYVRHGTTSLFAAYDLASGPVIAQHYRRHRHQEFLRFLKLIDTAVPRGLDLHLVLDNYATHKTPAIKEWLLKHPRFHLHFTPASSSWLNLVERWFAELTSRKLRRSAHRSVTGLEAGIRQWVNEWNKGPEPFTWNKSADDVLETLAAYCQRITGPGQQEAWCPPPGSSSTLDRVLRCGPSRRMTRTSEGTPSTCAACRSASLSATSWRASSCSMTPR
jgi:transposase